MDRNSYAMPSQEVFRVALRKESVDRNHAPKYHRIPLQRSLSARRAWIEIYFINSFELQRSMSLSARRAWIEMVMRMVFILLILVALRKESVDRNVLVYGFGWEV